MKRRQRSLRRNQRGFVLIALVALLVMGGLYFFISNLSPEAIEAKRQEKTATALVQAREALIGYALQYREQQIATGDPDAMYGYMPLPDFGESVNLNGVLANQPCTSEGCAKINPSGISGSTVIIGRFPWKTLGTEPLRDGYAECLWYAVSATHRAVSSTATTMNWDTLAVPDVVIGSGLATLATINAHDRPIAVIFSAGAAFDNGRTASADAPECGGNYDVTHYVDAALNNAQRSLPVTSDTLFGAIRKNAYFRTDVNAMLDRMTTCLRDQVAAGTGFTPDALSGFTAPTDKTVGRIPSSTCYDDTQNPLGYFSHYRDQVFVASKIASDFTVTDTKDTTAAGDDTVANCSAAIIFGGQRGSGQSRASTAELNTPANYLEGVNLTSFSPPNGSFSFTGPTLLAQVSASHTANQDIVRCIPAGASLTTVESPNLTAAQQLVAYDPASSTLTLGKQDVTNSTAGAGDLFGCAWIADEKTLGSGLRSYFQFSFATVGTSVGNTGFVFSLIDTESNTSLPCGGAGSHLGYSGDNTVTPKVKSPKIGIEFDQSRNTGFPGTSGESSTAVGRNDPCGTSTCGASPVIGYNSHAAIVYWGHEAANTTDVVTLPDGDDNVHGFPSAASLVTTRRPPTNPSASPGIEFVNLRTGGQLFHVRVELTPTRTVDVAASENSKSSMQTKVWILADSVTVANQIIAMKDTTRPMSLLYPSFTEKLSDTGVVFDVAESPCSSGVCPTNQTCGTDNVCYRQGLRKARLGFTGSQRTGDQEVTISNMFTTWLP